MAENSIKIHLIKRKEQMGSTASQATESPGGKS